MVKITLITATFNSEKTLRCTIESVLMQTYENIEYIIIDGKSNDKTLDIAQKYELQFKGRMRIISEPDKGIYDALNKGVATAKGDVIGFIHADDTIACDDIIANIAILFENTDCDVIYGDLLYVNSKDSVIRNWKSSTFKKSLLCQGWMPPHPTLYVKQEIYKSIGGFNTSYKISADYDFILRCFSYINVKKVLYLPRIFVKMKLGGASNKNLKNILIKMKEDWRAISQNRIGNPIIILLNKNLSKLRQFLMK